MITNIAAAIFGMALMVVLFYLWENRKQNKASSKSDEILKHADHKREKIIRGAREESQDMIKLAKRESSDIMHKISRTEERILEREEKIENRLDEIDKRQNNLIEKERKLDDVRVLLTKKENELDGKLSEISSLSKKEAKELFLKQVEEEYSDEWVEVVKKHKKRIEDKKQEISRDIILKSIQQYAGDVTSEVTTTLVSIPSDDLKGKLIGKEGRNITTFERATGVALIIDDTPDSVFISAFDLFKRYVAKKSLEKLIEDGRIQPARIEEVVAQTETEAEMLLTDLGNKILDELNITWLPEKLIPIIGKLRFRTSYGQNILKHSKEVALIAEQLAKDLGADPKIVKIGGLLHDIGKALDQEIEGTHPEIGGKIGRKYKLDPRITDMIENHHGEQFKISLEAAIVQVADAISSVRPWARREAIEDYVKRVQEMEALVASFSGVSKAYALSAGREVRVFVDAETISDLDAQNMAKRIAEDIQEKLSYPGEVKVHLIREMRVVQYAK